MDERGTFAIGERVTVRSDGPALQRGLAGVVEDRSGRWWKAYDRPWFADDVPVKLEPNAEGLYGGRYWFAPTELAPADGRER